MNPDIPEVTHDGPIPGQHLTGPFGDRPWQNPSQYSTVEEALEFYIPRLMDETFSDQLIDVIEIGIPLTAIANSLQLASVMEGKHSIDVGILLMPILIEMLELIATNAKIEYNKGTELKDIKEVSDVKLDKIVAKMRGDKEQQDMEAETMEDAEIEKEEVVEEEEPMGLMARRAG
tara:strand:- start:5411 stop:5935 length:525 start_codon:yes stop_codon:yes gene_type:complete